MLAFLARIEAVTPQQCGRENGFGVEEHWREEYERIDGNSS
jgi:hypothetical protein